MSGPRLLHVVAMYHRGMGNELVICGKNALGVCFDFDSTQNIPRRDLCPAALAVLRFHRPSLVEAIRTSGYDKHERIIKTNGQYMDCLTGLKLVVLLVNRLRISKSV